MDGGDDLDGDSSSSGFSLSSYSVPRTVRNSSSDFCPIVLGTGRGSSWFTDVKNEFQES